MKEDPRLHPVLFCKLDSVMMEDAEVSSEWTSAREVKRVHELLDVFIPNLNSSKTSVKY